MKDLKYLVVPCQCGYDCCSDWHISPDADVIGVSFDKETAEFICKMLNEREEKKDAESQR